MADYEYWPVDARNVVEKAIACHGGRPAWERLAPLRLEVLSYSGAVWGLKGAGKTFPVPRRFVVDPRAKSVRFPDYPTAGQAIVYRAGSVVTGADGPADVTGNELPNYRSRFSGLRTKLRKWSPADVAYFVGYSMANYHGYPFQLPRLSFVAHRRVRLGREAADRVVLRYPDGSDCHTEQQAFYFDRSGRLGRVDYSADIVGPGPAAAQHYEDYREVDGVLFPHRRRVLGRLLGVLTPINLVTVDLDITPAEEGSAV